jgi:hypothetical protein
MVKSDKSDNPFDVFDHTKRYNHSETFLDRLDPEWGRLALRLRALETQFVQDGLSGRTAKRILKTYQYLERFKNRLETGHTLSILHAARFCAKEGMPLPSWLGVALIEQIDRFMNPEHPSPLYDLNDCFSSDLLKDFPVSKRKTVARDQKAGFHFWVAVQELARSDLTVTSVNEAIDNCLKNAPWGFAKTKAKQLFKQVEDAQIAISPNYQGLSQKLAKRRHQS